MTPAFRKYGHVFLLGVQNALVYRWNFVIRTGFSLLHLVVVFVLWGAAYAGVDEIGGFPVEATIGYFLVMMFLQYMLAAFNEDFLISEEIRHGIINQFLLKPINYFLYRFWLFVAARAVTGIIVLIPAALLYPILSPYFILPEEAWRWAAFVPAAMLAALIQFTIAYCFGMLAFWFLEIQGFVILSFALETLLSGQIFPLDLLPAALFRISQFLPFYYQMYFPAAIVSGRIEMALVQEGLVIQTAWALILLVIAQLLWTRGLKKHTAVGG